MDYQDRQWIREMEEEMNYWDDETWEQFEESQEEDPNSPWKCSDPEGEF
jgi:hypothetical protein